MATNSLIAKVQSQISNSQLSFSTAMGLSQAEVTAIQTALGLAGTLTISDIQTGNVALGPNGDTLTITAASLTLFSSATPATVKMVFGLNAAQNGLDYTLEFSMPAAWSFSTGFSLPNAFPFNAFTFTGTYFVYTNNAQDSYSLGTNDPSIKLVEGLNYGSTITPGDPNPLSYILGNQAPSGSLTLSGDVSSVSNPYPVMDLTADLSISSLTLPGGLTLTIKEIDLSLSIGAPDPTTQEQPISLDIIITTADLVFTIDVSNSDNTIALSAGPSSNFVPTLNNLASVSVGSLLPSGTNFSDFVPSDILNAFKSDTGNLTLNSIDVTLTPSATNKVTSVSFSIGQVPNSSIPLGPLTFTQFSLKADWASPTPGAATDTATINVTAQANVDPTSIFTAPVDFTMSITKGAKGWAIESITGSDAQSFDLTTIINDIATANGETLVVPSPLQDLSFSNTSIDVEPVSDKYTCTTDGSLSLEIAGTTFQVSFTLTFGKTGSTYSQKISGSFPVEGVTFTFDLTLSETAGDTGLNLTASATSISLSDLIKGFFSDFGLDLSILPDITLESPTVTYDSDAKTFSVSATVDLGSNYTVTITIDAAYSSTTSKWEFVMVGELQSTDSWDLFSSLPVVGSELGGLLGFNELFLTITSKDPSGITSSASSKPDTITPGIMFVLDFTIMEESNNLVLPVQEYPVSGGKGNGAEQNPADSPDKAAKGSTPVQKKLGSVFLDSISASYTNKVLDITLTGGFTIGPLTATLIGLSFGSELTAFTPEFSLSGLSFDYNKPPLRIEGGIDHVPNPPSGTKFEYAGDLSVQAEEFGLSAIASYAELSNGDLPSFFLFVEVDEILGGPPWFIVEGLMGGLGYNMSLTTPTLGEVADFPLLAIGAATSSSSDGKASDTLAVLQGQAPGPVSGETVTWVAPTQGDYWLAAGVKFNSFEVIQGQLLFTVEFGKDLIFNILGMASITLPVPEGGNTADSFVYLELTLEAVLAPHDGYFTAGASLTPNSFVLTKDCHVTGGFAFYVWFGDNPHSGEFVLTVGGYHPAFPAPAYYPQVSRLGFNWQVASNISITGDCYFAMTPSFGMAGGSLNVLYQAGPVKAWFDAVINLLVAWHPFSFIGDISVSIGASVRLDLLFCHATVSVSLGAAIQIWGSPLGGKVRVHIVIVTVTIGFGSSEDIIAGIIEDNNTALSWSEFSQKLLPGNKVVCKVVPNHGITKNLHWDNTTGSVIHNNQDSGNGNAFVEDVQSTDNIEPLWITRAGTFSFSTQSVVPANKVNPTAANTAVPNVPDKSNMSIRPMFLDGGVSNGTNQGVTSTHNVSVTEYTTAHPEGKDHDLSTWAIGSNETSVPENLWGAPFKDNSDSYVQNPSKPQPPVQNTHYVGLSLAAPAPTCSDDLGPIKVTAISEEYIEKGVAQNPLVYGITTGSASTDFQGTASSTTVADIASTSSGIASGTPASNRQSLVSILNANGLYTGTYSALGNMQANADSLFTENPMEIS
ncbi:MAG: hypothetical protein HEP71_33070 [Roseivirga sp.]|nr:hypothetical protein [Roseivirga sp.]